MLYNDSMLDQGVQLPGWPFLSGYLVHFQDALQFKGKFTDIYRMTQVRPKKYLGQHFLKDKNIARKITDSLTGHGGYTKLMEIGPGTGVLTGFLLAKPFEEVLLVEIDWESVIFLKENFTGSKLKIIENDFLKLHLPDYIPHTVGVIGNFPYNISSQIFFKILENKDQVPEVVCMIQKEVAERICAGHGNKTYGILSVLLQAFFDVKVAFSKYLPKYSCPPQKWNPL